MSNASKPVVTQTALRRRPSTTLDLLISEETSEFSDTLNSVISEAPLEEEELIESSFCTESNSSSGDDVLSESLSLEFHKEKTALKEDSKKAE